jgi:PEP-CTERM motif
MKPTSKILAMTIRTALLVTGSCFLASFAHAAGPTVSTPNIFTAAPAAASSTINGAFTGSAAFAIPGSVDDGTPSQFFFGDGGSEYLSLAGFDATDGIDSIVFFGNTFSNRTSPGVTIYTSTTDEGNSLDPSDYTELGSSVFPLPTTDSLDNAYSEGVDPVSGRSYDVLSGLGIAAGTKSILFSFSGSVFGEGNGFTEIQAFPTSNISPIPEPGTWAMLLAGVGLLVGVLKFRNASRASLK